MQTKSAQRALTLAFLAILLIGLVVRVYGAWCERHHPRGDYAVVAEMAKHLAEGRTFPVFFYGQAYMGSLEPAVSALLCRLFGIHAFSVALGTALVAFILLPVVFFWGRAAGGPVAGLAAMLFCLIGPFTYFFYMASPRGGYAITLVLGSLVLWLAGKIAFGERQRAPVAPGWYLLLGLAAGLGWWSNQLITPALATVALVILAAARGRIFSGRVAAAALMFMVGSLPWWWWNAVHQWGSLQFAGALGTTRLSEGLPRYVESFWKLTELLDTPLIWQVAFCAILGLSLLLPLAQIIRHWRERVRVESDFHILTALIFLVVFLLIAAQSHYIRIAEARYLMPLWPAFGVLLGVLTATLTRRGPRGLGWLPLACLVAWQVQSLPHAWREKCAWDATWKKAGDLGRFTREHGIEVIYGDYWSGWVNFATAEKICLCGLEWELYAPYEKQAALSTNYALLNNIGEFRSFLSAAGGRAEHADVAGFKLDYAVRLPPPASQVPPARWAAARDETGSNVLALVADQNLDSAWVTELAPERTNRLVEIVLTEPLALSGIRLWSGKGRCPPGRVRIEGRAATNEAWEELLPEVANTEYFWSGPRLYWRGPFYRSEFRFPDRRLSALRIFFPEHQKTYTAHLAEIHLLTSGIPPGSEPGGIPDLLRLLEERRIAFLYADRWVAEQVFTRSQERIQAPVDGLFRRSVQELPVSKAPDYPGIDFTPATALLTFTADAPLCRERLQARRMALRETEIGPWTLFDFGPGQWQEYFREPSELFWAGPTALAADHQRWAKPRAAQLYREAESRLGRQVSDPDALRLLEAALREYDRYQPAQRALEPLLRKAGRIPEADQLAERYRRDTEPETPAAIRFANRVEFLGLTVQPRQVKAGGVVTIRYYWRCPATLKASDYAVFVHIRQDEHRFQDDHVLLESVRPEYLAFQPFAEVFMEERRVPVPADMIGGEFYIQLGLLDRTRGNQQLRLKTALPCEERAVTIPATLVVAE